MLRLGRWTSNMRPDLASSIWEVPLAFLDVETTGLSPERGDRVCEVAILLTQGDEIVDGYQQLLNPQRKIGAGAQAVNGITDEMVAGCPRFSQVADRVLDLLEGAVFVGHNAAFDLGFVSSELNYVGRSLPELVVLDTLRLARRQYRLPSYALGRLAEALQVDVDGRAHRAMVDVLFTRGVFLRTVDDLWDAGLRSVSDLLRFQGAGIVSPAPDLDVPAPIRRALEDEGVLWLHYRAEDGEETERFVRPLRIHSFGGSPILVAHCLLKDAKRSFRLDRILEAELVQEPGQDTT